jgi:UDP-glucose 4-epimerase
MDKNYNILILGGNGFLGRNLVKGLINDGLEVSVYDINPPVAFFSEVMYYQGNLKDIDTIVSIINARNINVIVHMVSTIIPGSSLDQYINNCKIVQLATIPIMDYCATNNIRMVYFSSGGTVYGIKGGTISENEPVAPISYYGLSKIQIEDLIHFYHRRYNLDYLIIRPSNPFGPGQNLYGKQGLIAVILGHMLKDESVTIYGDGSVIRDYIYIDDLIYYVKELIKKDIKNETINIGSGVGTSINQIMDIVEEVSGVQLKKENVPSRKDDVPKMILDTTRLHNFVKHEDSTVKDGIRKFYQTVMKVQE